MKLGEFSAALPKGDLWVFGYGSLMWSPCFDYASRVPGRAHGYHRALCILSTRYRGTKSKPGLVMGLCRGGSCWGVAYRIDGPRLRRALARLWYREMPRRVYEPRLIPVRLQSGRTVYALAFIADPAHPAYVRELDLPELVLQLGERARLADRLAVDAADGPERLQQPVVRDVVVPAGVLVREDQHLLGIAVG